MFLLFEKTEIAAVETLLVSIPESVGVLVFGLGLMFLAVLIRRLLTRTDGPETGKKAGKQA